jgi:hypothetical protein
LFAACLFGMTRTFCKTQMFRSSNSHACRPILCAGAKGQARWGTNSKECPANIMCKKATHLRITQLFTTDRTIYKAGMLRAVGKEQAGHLANKCARRRSSHRSALLYSVHSIVCFPSRDRRNTSLLVASDTDSGCRLLLRHGLIDLGSYRQAG